VFGRRPSSKSTADTTTVRRAGGSTAARVVSDAERAAGKGRPTPTRREAEEARKQRLTPPRTRKEAAAAQRRKRAETMAARREAMRSGDDRYLPARDQGPVRRFARDYVDARWNAAEFLLPVLIAILVLSMIPGNGRARHDDLAAGHHRPRPRQRGADRQAPCRAGEGLPG
jgi:hypothetical protein